MKPRLHGLLFEQFNSDEELFEFIRDVTQDLLAELNNLQTENWELSTEV